MKNFVIVSFYLLFLASCGSMSEEESLSVSGEFSDYWFQGKGEVVSYSLSQSRYGEVREGHAVLIFVTEPFSKKLQVKLDNPDEAAGDKITVMKLNMMKKFTTGIYPYSMMLSAFSPVDNDQPPHPLKVTMSGQEWCGHVFAQVNRRDDQFRLREFSYFQSEGDNEKELSVALMEDEIWNMIRMDPGALPVGQFSIYPGLFYTRLMHKPFEAEQASASLNEERGKKKYIIRFESGRTFEWIFDAQFPHTIYSWEETFPGNNGQMQVTSATLKKQLFLPYWQYNGNKDIILRDSLGIE